MAEVTFEDSGHWYGVLEIFPMCHCKLMTPLCTFKCFKLSTSVFTQMCSSCSTYLLQFPLSGNLKEIYKCFKIYCDFKSFWSRKLQWGLCIAQFCNSYVVKCAFKKGYGFWSLALVACQKSNVEFNYCV